MARQLIASLSDDFDADRFEDTYRNQVLDLIERKAAGETEIVAPPEAMSRGQGRRPDGRPRGQRQGGQGGPQAPSGRLSRRRGGGRSRPRSAPASRRSGVPDQVVEVDGRQLKVSNLDKVLYPDAGFTKAEVIDYYVRVAPVMLPHIADRGVTLRRYPNGVDETSFFEKRCPSHRPEWIGTFEGPGDRNGTIGYCALDSVAALAWSANMAALELHAPMARGRRHRRRRRCACSTSTRARAPASPSARRSPSTSARCSTTWPGSTCLRQDLGLEGAAGVRAAQHAAHPRALLRVRPGRGPGAREAPPQPGDVGDEEERPAPARSSSTGARTAATRPRWPSTRCGPGRVRPCPRR